MAAMNLGLNAEHCERHPEREHECDGEERVDCRVFDGPADLALKTPPDERLIDLMDGEQQRRSRKRYLMRFVDMAKSIDSNRTHDETGDKVGLGRKTHCFLRPRPMSDGRGPAASAAGPCQGA